LTNARAKKSVDDQHNRKVIFLKKIADHTSRKQDLTRELKNEETAYERIRREGNER